MTRITTAAQNNLVLFYMQQNQSQLADLNAAISTGQKAQTYAQIAPEAKHLVDFRAQSSRQQDFMNTIDSVSTRLQIGDLSLAQIQDGVTKLRALLPNAAFNTAQPDISAQAKLLLQQVAGFLNIQDGTRYLYGGTNSATPPVSPPSSTARRRPAVIMPAAAPCRRCASTRK
jgi:flagellar hook-associated protein 3 FlgL